MQINPHALRVIRERSGMSLTELARRAGISQPHLSNLERGRRQASASTVRRLADALKVPVPALLADPPATDGGPSLAPDDDPDPWSAPRLVVDPEVEDGRRGLSGPCRGSAPRPRSPG